MTSSVPRTSLEHHCIKVEEVESIRRLLKAGEMKKARAAVTEHMIDVFSVCGPVDELAARIEKLKRLGIDCRGVALESSGEHRLCKSQKEVYRNFFVSQIYEKTIKWGKPSRKSSPKELLKIWRG